MDIPKYLKVVCAVIALIALGLLNRRRIYTPNDCELLEKPLIESERSSFMDSDNKLRVRYVNLIERLFGGREYQIADSPDDGYLPNDSDGLVDSISKRDYYRPGGNIFSYRMKRDRGYRKTPWTYIPFEQELYQIATERYKEALAKTGSSPRVRNR